MAPAPQPPHPRTMKTNKANKTNKTNKARNAAAHPIAHAIRDFAGGVNTAHAIRHGTRRPPASTQGADDRPPTPTPPRPTPC
jgi:hypothetical protein